MMLAFAWILLKASLDNMREVSTIVYISSALGKVRVKIRRSIMQQRRKVGENVFHHYSPKDYISFFTFVCSVKILVKKKKGRSSLIQIKYVSVCSDSAACTQQTKTKSGKNKRNSCFLTHAPQIHLEPVDEQYARTGSLLFNRLRDWNVALHLKCLRHVCKYLSATTNSEPKMQLFK